jgi:hypothetical protein
VLILVVNVDFDQNYSCTVKGLAGNANLPQLNMSPGGTILLANALN